MISLLLRRNLRMLCTRGGKLICRKRGAVAAKGHAKNLKQTTLDFASSGKTSGGRKR